MRVRDYEGEVVFAHYDQPRRLAIRIISPTEGPLFMATVNMPDVPLPQNHVLIKNWSENEGVMEALQSAGIIGPILHAHCNGHVTATEHEVLSVDSNPVFAQFEQMRKSGLLGLEDFVRTQFELLVPYKPDIQPIAPHQLAHEFTEALAARSLTPSETMLSQWFAGFIRGRLQGDDPVTALENGEPEMMPSPFGGEDDHIQQAISLGAR